MGLTGKDDNEEQYEQNGGETYGRADGLLWRGTELPAVTRLTRTGKPVFMVHALPVATRVGGTLVDVLTYLGCGHSLLTVGTSATQRRVSP